MKKGHLHLVLGGSRSGKSTWAEKLARQSTRPVAYLATCRTLNMDTEMKDRIERHRQQRPSHWVTIEDRFDLHQIAHEYKGYTLLIDCLTMWLANELAKNDIDQILDRLAQSMDALIQNDIEVIIVSNEVGMGIVPLGEETRKYRDLVGWGNQLVAQKATDVQWLQAGLCINLKKNGRTCDLDTEAN